MLLASVILSGCVSLQFGEMPEWAPHNDSNSNDRGNASSGSGAGSSGPDGGR